MSKQDIHKALIAKLVTAKEIVSNQKLINLMIMKDAIEDELKERGY